MDDSISRQAAIDALADMHCKSDEDGYIWIIRSDAWARIDALPSAQPERKKGCKIVKGTGTYGYCACDQCGKPVHPEDKFCSNCGADFREEDT